MYCEVKKEEGNLDMIEMINSGNPFRGAREAAQHPHHHQHPHRHPLMEMLMENPLGREMIIIIDPMGHNRMGHHHPHGERHNPLELYPGL